MASSAIPRRTSSNIRTPNSPLRSATTPGNAAAPIQRRAVLRAASSIPAGWRRCSSAAPSTLEFIRGSGQLGDTVTYLSGGLVSELWNLIRPRRRVEDDGREPKTALQGPASGVHVLHPRHRHQRPRDPHEPTLEIPLERTYLVAPPSPQQGRQHED